MSTTINGVTVRLARDPDDWRKYRIEILVDSRVKPGFKAMQYLDPGKATGAREVIKGVGAAAALCAEYLGLKYKEAVDPSCCIRDAIQAFGEECRLMGELARDLPSKLLRIRASGKLSGQEREVLDRMIWLTDRGERLTRDECELVNNWVGDLHGAQL
jgi:hypothetical protein